MVAERGESDMTKLTDALSKAFSISENEDDIVEALINIGWTPPPKKPDPPEAKKPTVV